MLAPFVNRAISARLSQHPIPQLMSCKLLIYNKKTMEVAPKIVTAGGRITCRRCTAHSSRTGLQCRRPALKSSRTQKCQFHGGRGSGPKTVEGRARIAAAHRVHGRETKAKREDRSAASARLSRLEDAMRVLGMTSATRIRGRKARGYEPVRTVADVRDMIIEECFHRDNGGARGSEKIYAENLSTDFPGVNP